MKLPKQKYADVVDKAKRQLEIMLTRPQKAERAAVEADRLRRIQQTAHRSSKRLRAMAERRSATGDEGLAANASRNSTRHKLHPLTIDENAEKARAEAERRSVAGAKFLAAEAAQL